MSLVYGIGINDCKGWATRENKKPDDLHLRIYSLWIRVLSRGYSESYKKTHPTYKDVTVCQRWHRLSVFADDITKLPNYKLWEQNPLKRICLDKDIRVSGNKEYRPEACMFVTTKESNQDVRKRHGTNFTKEILERTALKNYKPIICTYPDGNERTFQSIKEAVVTGGFQRINIYKCCNGKRKTHKGCQFRYV